MERGKQPLLLNRAASTRSLFVDSARGASPPTQPLPQQQHGAGGSGGGASEDEAGGGGGGGGQALEALRLRVQELEADNLRLKARNTQLEGLLSSAQQHQQQQQHSPQGAAEASGSQPQVLVGGSPGISPREAGAAPAPAPARAEEQGPHA